MLSNLKTGSVSKSNATAFADPFWITLKPERTARSAEPDDRCSSDRSTTKRRRSKEPHRQTRAFKEGDKIVAVDGQPVNDFAKLVRQLAHRANDTLRVAVERLKPDQDRNRPRTGPAETVEIDVPANPFKTLGW